VPMQVPKGAAPFGFCLIKGCGFRANNEHRVEFAIPAGHLRLRLKTSILSKPAQKSFPTLATLEKQHRGRVVSLHVTRTTGWDRSTRHLSRHETAQPNAEIF